MGTASVKSAKKHSISSERNTKPPCWRGPAVLPAPPGKPILVTLPTEDSQHSILTIRWERSPSNGGSAIIGYLVEHRHLGSSNWLRSSANLCSYTEMTFGALEPGWRYQFRVRAQNGVGCSQPSELSDPLTVTLQRTFVLAPQFSLDLKDTTVFENQQAEFIVQFSGTPVPKISWLKDGFEIFSSRRTRIVTENGRSILTIHQTALNDEGEIICTAVNKAGYVSTRAKLDLEAPPRVRLPRHYEDGLLSETDETVKLKVFVAGRPPPAVTWLHNAQIIESDDRHVIESSGLGEYCMRLTTAKRNDRGEYTVNAINKLGDDSASFLLTVTDRPAAPGRAIVSMTLGKSIILSWSEPEDDGGCEIGSYIVEYYRIGWDVWLKATTCRQRFTTLCELIGGSEYKFRIKAENPYGVGDPSEESEVIFIPDMEKRSMNPPLRWIQTRSQGEINRYGGAECENRNQTRNIGRSRSLSRDKPCHELSRKFRGPSSKTVSTSAATPEHCKVDSRVSFDDTVYLHVKSLSEMSPITSSHMESGINHDGNSKNCVESSSFQTKDIQISSKPAFSDAQTFNDSEGLFDISSWERSLSTIQTRANQSGTLQHSLRGKAQYPHYETYAFKADFGFMKQPCCVMNRKGKYPTSLSLSGKGANYEDLIPPILSQSLPELFTKNHQVIKVMRKSVSSTEMLYERAIEKFYEAVASQVVTKRSSSTIRGLREDLVSNAYVSGSAQVNSTLYRKVPDQSDDVMGIISKDSHRSGLVGCLDSDIMPQESMLKTVSRSPYKTNLVSNIQPRSILKKSGPSNRINRSMSPNRLGLGYHEREKKISTKTFSVVQKRSRGELGVFVEGASSIVISNVSGETIMSDVDSENSNLLNAAQAARNRRRPNEIVIPEGEVFSEREGDFVADEQVMDHCTESAEKKSSKVNALNIQRSELLDPESDGLEGSSSFPLNGKQLFMNLREPIEVEIEREISKHEGNDTFQSSEISAERLDDTAEYGKRIDRELSECCRIPSESTLTSMETILSLSSVGSSSNTTSVGDSKNGKYISERIMICQCEPFKPASLKSLHLSHEMNPAGSETFQKIVMRRSDVELVKRSSQSCSRTDGRQRLENSSDSDGIRERLINEAKFKVRSFLSYSIDITLLTVAVYIYLFGSEIYAIPIIGLILFRRIREDIIGWIPKNLYAPFWARKLLADSEHSKT